MEQLSQLFNVNYFIVSQTNPHIVPILRIKGGLRLYIRRFRGLLILSSLRNTGGNNPRVLPGADVLDAAKLFGQTWEGDVTVVMAYGWRHENDSVQPDERTLFEL